ncbi:MAG: hypothetical protein PHQ67_08280 [Fermentimonas sp.]|nr:hypothetical protein [Fermentimonas sp.]
MKIIIDEELHKNRVSLFLIDQRYSSTDYLFYDDGEMKRVTVKPGEIISKEIKPLVEVSMDVFAVLLTDLVDYAKMKGIKVEREDKLSGRLAATERHLEDLKTIAFHALKIEK